MIKRTILLMSMILLAIGVAAAPEPAHYMWGYVNGGVDGAVVTLFIDGRPEEVLTDMVGSDVAGGWKININELPTDPQEGETAVITYQYGQDCADSITLSVGVSGPQQAPDLEPVCSNSTPPSIPEFGSAAGIFVALGGALILWKKGFKT